MGWQGIQGIGDSVDKILEIKLEVDPSARGVELKRKQAELVNLLPLINEAKDRYALVVSARKARIADLEAEATLETVRSEDFKLTKSTVQSKVLKAMVRTFEYYVDYQEVLDKNSPAEKDEGTIRTTISIEEHLLGLDNMYWNKARSKAEELVQLLWVCRSGLSFDKEDMAHGSSQ